MVTIADLPVKLIYEKKKSPASFRIYGGSYLSPCLESVVMLLWKHWAEVNSVHNLVY